jgi:hypothetical protein
MNDSESGCSPFLETIWHSPEMTREDNYSNIFKIRSCKQHKWQDLTEFIKINTYIAMPPYWDIHTC